MLKHRYSVRCISKGDEAEAFRTIVVDQNFVCRPFLRGTSLDDHQEQRTFQEVFEGDFILSTSLEPGAKIPRLKVTRHKGNPISGLFVGEVLNRIHPILASYLMNYNLERRNP